MGTRTKRYRFSMHPHKSVGSGIKTLNITSYVEKKLLLAGETFPSTRLDYSRYLEALVVVEGQFITLVKFKGAGEVCAESSIDGGVV